MFYNTFINIIIQNINIKQIFGHIVILFVYFRQLLKLGMRQNVPPAGFGVGRRREARSQEQKGSDLATTAGPTTRVLWLRAKTLREGCAPHDDNCS